MDRRTGKPLKADFTKHDNISNIDVKFWLIGNIDNANRRAYREFNVAIPFEFPRELLKTYITNMKQDDPQWGAMMSILDTDKKFEDFIRNTPHYLNAIYVKEAEEDTPTDKVYNPYEAPLKSTSNVSINYRYIHTNVELSKDTFAEAIKQEHYIENECWINSIYDFYKDSLLRESKRQRITRETILEIIGHTEDTVKQGISLEDIKKKPL